MKIRSLPLYDQYDDGTMLVCGSNVVIDLGYIPLGNNFSYDHIFDNMSEEQKEFLYNNVDLNDDVRLVAKLNYGRLEEDTCGSDIIDHIR